MIHDRNNQEYQVFSAASLKRWSKFGLADEKEAILTVLSEIETTTGKAQTLPLVRGPVDCGVDPGLLAQAVTSVKLVEIRDWS